jgi:2-hydroxycyclohexanecarboxyl-CoA dehydrogenase
MMRFAERVAVVTGGASGIGLATARLLTAEGARVALADLDAARAESAAAELEGGRAYAVDVTDAGRVAEFAAEVERDLGPVAVVVSNAGWDESHPFLETDAAFWEKVIDVNYKGHLAVAHALVPYLVERGSGAVVTVASDAGRVGSSGEAVYSGAKGAVIAFTKALAREVARGGVRVNCVAPGLTDTPLLERMTAGSPRLMEAIIKSIPLRRPGTPDEVARAIAFLASDDATYITGQVLSVNGGLNMV